MSGRDYTRPTVYYTADYLHKNKILNENYRSIVKESAITYLRTTRDNTAAKVEYLKGLTRDVYRYGVKHKYECNLNAEDINYIIRSVDDDALHLAYFGRTVSETPDDRRKAIISAGVIIVFFFFFITAIASHQ